MSDRAFIVRTYHQADVSRSIQMFEAFGQKTDLPEAFFLDMLGFMASFRAEGDLSLVQSLETTGLVSSLGEAKRAISQGSVTVNNVKILDTKAKLPVQEWLMLGVGKAKRVVVYQAVGRPFRLEAVRPAQPAPL